MQVAYHSRLTHWGRATHICVGKLTTIGSDNGLSPGRRQAIIWTNAGILLIGTLGTNFSEILIDFHTFSFKKMRLKVSSAKRRTFCLGLNVLTTPFSWLMMPRHQCWPFEMIFCHEKRITKFCNVSVRYTDVQFKSSLFFLEQCMALIIIIGNRRTVMRLHIIYSIVFVSANAKRCLGRRMVGFPKG